MIYKNQLGKKRCSTVTWSTVNWSTVNWSTVNQSTVNGQPLFGRPDLYQTWTRTGPMQVHHRSSTTGPVQVQVQHRSGWPNYRDPLPSHPLCSFFSNLFACSFLFFSLFFCVTEMLSSDDQNGFRNFNTRVSTKKLSSVQQQYKSSATHGQSNNAELCPKYFCHVLCDVMIYVRDVLC